jgi:IS5 family transposase
MRRYFYGVKVQVLTLQGIPVEFCITPGSQSDVKALQKLPLDVPAESTIYADSAYTDYLTEDIAFDASGIHLAVQRQKNSKRKEPAWMEFLKQHMHKGIETSFSCIKAKMLRNIHAVIPEGFFLKIALFIISYAFEKLML